MEPIIRMYEAIQANSISSAFFWVILATLGYALISINSSDERRRTLVDLAPGILTTLGILGTFTGVFLGLLDFDVRLINKSVPTLLEGLKVAFGTSIVGLAAALSFRIARPLLSKTSVSEEAGIEDIVEELRSVKRALSGDEDSSLLTQFQKLRAELSFLNTQTKEGFDNQIEEFRKFSEKMSEAFSKALIDELKAAIRQFNEDLAEQFGKNFQEFNAALGRILEWQEHYKTELSRLRDSLDKSRKLLEQASEALSDVSENTASIPQHMSELSSLYKVMNSDLEKMNASVQSFADMGKKASDAMPTIERNVAELTENFKRATENQQSAINSMALSIEQSLGDMKETNAQMLEGLQQSFNKVVSDANEQLVKGVDQLDQAISEELERALTEMANNLTGITNQFVKDYEPLLQSSRKLIQLAEASKPQ